MNAKRINELQQQLSNASGQPVRIRIEYVGTTCYDIVDDNAGVIIGGLRARDLEPVVSGIVAGLSWANSVLSGAPEGADIAAEFNAAEVER